MNRSGLLLCVGFLLLASGHCASAQLQVDSALLAEINQIKAIDNHCHCLPSGGDREAHWREEEPLGAPPYPAVVRLRVDNPEWARAWAALYGYAGSGVGSESARPLLREKLRRMRQLGERYPAWVLDRAGVEVALVNAASLGPGQAGPRFRWVPYADSLIAPSATSLQTVAGDLAVDRLPAGLSGYTAGVVTPVLDRWVKQGVRAVKFTTAYRRALNVTSVEFAVAEQAYARVQAADDTVAEKRLLEDYLFRYVCAEAGRLGLVVQIHTGNGVGPYFDNSGADPGLLEPLLNDPASRETNFVLIHGGWPFHKLAGAMLDKPNTYADFSAQTFYLSTQALAAVLRDWLEWQPEKVLFGSDAYSDPNTPLADWEEKAWLMTTTAREALALALTGMMRDGQITPARAVEIARLVLRENAIRLYRLE